MRPDAGGLEREKENGRLLAIVERLDDFTALGGLAGEDEIGAAAFLEFGLEDLEHLDELGEDEDLVAAGVERLEDVEKRGGLAGAKAFLAAGE